MNANLKSNIALGVASVAVVIAALSFGRDASSLKAPADALSADQMKALVEEQVNTVLLGGEKARQENAHRALDLAREGEEAVKTLPPGKTVFDYIGKESEDLKEKYKEK